MTPRNKNYGPVIVQRIGFHVLLKPLLGACALPKVHPAEKLINLIRSQQAWTSTRALRKTLKNECNKRIPLRVVALPNCVRRSVADSGVCGLTWSNKSWRQLSTHRSAIPFCQGLSNEVRTEFTPSERTAAATSKLNS